MASEDQRQGWEKVATKRLDAALLSTKHEKPNIFHVTVQIEIAHADFSKRSLFLRFKGQKKGGVTENASYYIFTQCPDGAFEAFPVHGWYNFTPLAKHRTLTAEEAEEEWGR